MCHVLLANRVHGLVVTPGPVRGRASALTRAAGAARGRAPALTPRARADALAAVPAPAHAPGIEVMSELHNFFLMSKLFIGLVWN